MISPKICHSIHYQYMSKYVTVATSNTWDTKYVTVSNTWARKDTVTSYFTKYTLCSALCRSLFSLRVTGHKMLLKSDSFLEKMELYMVCAIFGDKYLTFSNYSIVFHQLSLVFTMFFTTKESTPAVSDVCD